MTKQDLIKDMKQFVNGSSFMTQAQVVRYMRRSKNTIKDLLRGIDYHPSGRDHKYFIPDVAQRIVDTKQVG